MDKKTLVNVIKQKQSFLCVGLDTEPGKLPTHLHQDEDAIVTFNKAIVDATIEYAVAYKPNLAFYESLGLKGWIALEKTMQYIASKKANVFTIADAKRGDIGNTSKQYAKAFFEAFQFDAITVAPYMGEDSVSPFLTYEGKWAVVLGLTSNKGADDFQFIKDVEGKQMFEHVIGKASKWGTDENMMFVVGATKATMLSSIRKIIPAHFLLVPGVGAQGGSMEEVAEYGMTDDCGLLVNASRSILYASSGLDFAQAAGKEAQAMQQQMAALLKQKGIV